MVKDVTRTFQKVLIFQVIRIANEDNTEQSNHDQSSSGSVFILI